MRDREELREATKWNGEYKGIRFELSLHGVGDDFRPEGTWAYYLMLSEVQFAPEDWEKVWREPTSWYSRSAGFETPSYTDHGWLESLDFRGGITLYEKNHSPDVHPENPEPQWVKVGCDYAHSWDEGISYSRGVIESDAKNSINLLHDLIRIKMRCQWTGVSIWEEDGVRDDEGGFYSHEGLEKRNEFRTEIAERKASDDDEE